MTKTLLRDRFWISIGLVGLSVILTATLLAQPPEPASSAGGASQAAQPNQTSPTGDTAQPPIGGDSAAAPADPAPADDAGTGDSGAADSGAEERPLTWMERVDQLFGDYIVSPLGMAIFFDFGTGHFLGTSIPFVVIWLFCGAVFFTLRMGFINVRGFWHAIRLTRGDFDKEGEAGEVSHFQALSSALSATVGLGNIAGVAIAIGTGGPGATFWMIVVGLLGMTSKFAECALGQMYRKVEKDGTVSGGPMRYLKDGLAEMGLGGLGTVLATVYAVICTGASFGGGNAFQVSQSLSAVRTAVPVLDDYPWIYGLIMAVMVGIVIIGGIRSIGAVAGKIVPLMCGAYVLAALYILAANYDRIVPSFGLIFGSAFSPGAMYGGFLGVLVIGVTRAVFSNEAGVGSAAIAHSAARTDEPVSEGIVALLEPFIDTVVVCTMTALVIIVTNTYADPQTTSTVAAINEVTTELTTQQEENGTVPPATTGAQLAAAETDAWETPLRYSVQTGSADGADSFIVSSAGPDKEFGTDDDVSSADKSVMQRGTLIASDDGAALTAIAFETGGYSWFRYILYLAVVLFAYSTLISWSYYGERCWTQLFGIRTSMVYKVIFLAFTVLGSIVTAANVRSFSDLLILGLAFPNILGVAILSGKVKQALDKYWDKYKSGELEGKKEPSND